MRNSFAPSLPVRSQWLSHCSLVTCCLALGACTGGQSATTPETFGGQSGSPANAPRPACEPAFDQEITDPTVPADTGFLFAPQEALDRYVGSRSADWVVRSGEYDNSSFEEGSTCQLLPNALTFELVYEGAPIRAFREVRRQRGDGMPMLDETVAQQLCGQSYAIPLQGRLYGAGMIDERFAVKLQTSRRNSGEQRVVRAFASKPIGTLTSSITLDVALLTRKYPEYRRDDQFIDLLIEFEANEAPDGTLLNSTGRVRWSVSNPVSSLWVGEFFPSFGGKPNTALCLRAVEVEKEIP